MPNIFQNKRRRMRGLLRMINDSDKENEGWLNKKDKFREKVKNFLYKIWFSKWLILLVVISIVSPIFIYLQVAQSEIISDNTKGDFESLGIAFQILIPLIPTIISIVLSLNEEKIFGLTKKEINLLRREHVFGIFGMVSISLILLLLFTIFSFIRMTWIVFGILTATFLLSFWFSYEQLGLLIGSHPLEKTLRRYYLENQELGFTFGKQMGYATF